jgi:hypothetical protein
MYISGMAQATSKPTTEPLPAPAATPSTSPSLALPANQLFRAVSRIAYPPAGWDRYEAASEQGRATIERQWKNNWRSDEAQRLYRRAVARRRAADGRAAEPPATDNHAADKTSANSQPAPASTPADFTRKLTFDEQNALHAIDPGKYWRYVDWLFVFHAPVTKRWDLREFLHRRDLDHEREIEGGDDYEVTPEQFGWSSR